jgi:Herpesviridae UL52/UL70 DNA primase
MLEAKWDPVQGKVIYVDATKTADNTGPTLSNTSSAAVVVAAADAITTTTTAVGGPGSATQRRRSRTERTANATVASTDLSNSFLHAHHRSDRDRHRRSDPIEQQQSTANENQTPAWRGGRRSTSTTAQGVNRTRSRGVAPSVFHANSAWTVPKNDAMDSLRREIQHKVISGQSRRQRKLLQQQRAYFDAQTVYKVYPLQDLAVAHWQELRHVWSGNAEPEIATASSSVESGAADKLSVQCHNDHTPTISWTTTASAAGNSSQSSNDDNGHGGSCGAVSMASSSSSSSSDESASESVSSGASLPPAKRCWRNPAAPTTTTNTTTTAPLDQFKAQLQQQLQTRRFLPDSMGLDSNESSPLTSALWCLEPRLFGVERIGSGQRQYVVAHAGRFLDHYWRTWPTSATVSLSSSSNSATALRHAYELIRPDTPCRLYLDIEASVTDQPRLVHDMALQEQFLAELYRELALEWQVHYQAGHRSYTTNDDETSASRSGGGRSIVWQPLQRSHIVDLDSSTATKFSRHWIVHWPMRLVAAAQAPSVTSTSGSAATTTVNSTPIEALFPSATAVGIFVRQWVGRLAQEHATGRLQQLSPALHECLFFTKPGAAEQPSSSLANQASSTAAAVVADRVGCVIDTGVYTRNRLFRLLGSCKHGKPATAALRIARDNQFPFPPAFGNHCFYPPAMQASTSTIRTTNGVGNDENVANPPRHQDCDVDDELQKAIARTDWTAHAEALAQTFVVPLNSVKNINVILSVPEETLPILAKPTLPSYRGTTSLSTLRLGPTPYPIIDAFVLQELAVRGGVEGTIRGWSVDCDPTTRQTSVIHYQIGRNRWCECIGRAHKSNHIAWHVDVRLKHCYQTCHDPECRALGFRGRTIPLPAILARQLEEQLWEEDLGRLELPPAFVQCESKFNTEDAKNNDDSFDLALASLSLDDIVPTQTDCSLDEVPVALKHRDQSQYNHRNDINTSAADQVESADHGDSSVEWAMRTTNDSSIPASNMATKHNCDSDDSDSDDDLLDVARRLQDRGTV